VRAAFGGATLPVLIVIAAAVASRPRALLLRISPAELTLAVDRNGPRPIWSIPMPDIRDCVTHRGPYPTKSPREWWGLDIVEPSGIRRIRLSAPIELEVDIAAVIRQASVAAKRAGGTEDVVEVPPLLLSLMERSRDG